MACLRGLVASAKEARPLEIELRVARMEDCASIDAAIAESARALGRSHYSEAVIEAALQGVWGLDTQLVRDGTYYLVYGDHELAACGGWSYRATLFGSEAEGSRDARLLAPAHESARIRAFFVRPQFARQGIGSRLLAKCEQEARKAGFESLTLGATAMGRRLYATHGFVPGASNPYDLENGLTMEILTMTKSLG